jgi:hypothetical protein
MSNCGTFYGCGQPVTDFGAPTGGTMLLDRFNAASLQDCKAWDPECIPRPLTPQERAALDEEVQRLKGDLVGYCVQMGTLGESLLNGNGGSVQGYDEPDAPADFSGTITFGDTYVDPNTHEIVIHLGAYQRMQTGNNTSPVRRIGMWELKILFNHELAHLISHRQSDTDPDFKLVRSMCG